MLPSLRQPSGPAAYVRDALKWMQNRLRTRPDSEHEMTPNRLVLGGMAFLYLLITAWSGNAVVTSRLHGIYLTFSLYFMASLMIFLHILWKPEICPRRRISAMIGDFGMVTYLGFVGGIESGFFYPLYLWTVFGNGFRFGVRYLYAAMIMGNAGFLTVLYATSALQQYPGISVALLMCLIIVPLYAARLIRKLSEAKHQAEEANRAKSMFLASVSHEVRTPLNAIIGLGTLLQDKLYDSESRETMSTIVNSGRSLLSLINSILDFSRIEAGHMPSKAVETNLYEAMGRLKAMLAAQAMSKELTFGMHITARTPARILADYGHIEQILINLASNAIKFTEKGFVVITIDGNRQDKERVRLRFEVSDTGIGIPADAQDLIFERFVQADSTILDRYGGTGLGLAISKQLVNLLNGRMGLESTAGKGSTFWFEVDVTAIPEDGDQHEIDEISAILFSRDDELEAMLENTGISVVRTVRPEEAKAAAYTHQSTFGEQPFLFVDQRDLADTLEDVANVFDDLTAAAIFVAEMPGISGLPLRLQSRFVTSLSMPVEGGVVRNALHLVKLARNSLRAKPQKAEVFTAASRTLSVLVAEDNRTNQMVIVKTLERFGHSATVVNDGEAALNALDRKSFDVVLMDVNMPVMNGIEATKLHRMSTIGETHVPIIALTADATADALDRCRQAGMDGYLTKPIEPARLVGEIERVLRRSEVSQVVSTKEPAIREMDDIPAPKSESLLDLGALADLESLGGCAFVSDLVSQFSRDAAELLSSLRAAAAEEDVQRFREAAHALRGSAANLGAAKVFESCMALRAITPSQLALDGEVKLAWLVSDVDRSVKVLKRYVASLHDNDVTNRKAQPSGN
jgi:two-component system sensor histidine kinase RpfC